MNANRNDHDPMFYTRQHSLVSFCSLLYRLRSTHIAHSNFQFRRIDSKIVIEANCEYEIAFEIHSSRQFSAASVADGGE